MKYAEDGNAQSRVKLFLLSSAALYGFFFVYDSPSPMFPELKKTFGEDYAASHSLLYSAYALPNLLLPLITSTSLKLSTSKTMLYTFLLIVLGQGLVWGGCYSELFAVIVAGRFVIGLGGESFSVAQNKMLSSLFHSHEYGRVFGVSLAIARMGSITAYLLLGRLVTQGIPLCAGIGFGLILVCGFLCYLIDREWQPGDVVLNNQTTNQENHFLLPHMLSVTLLVACAVSPFSGASSAILQQRLSVSYETTSRILAIQEGVSLVSTVVISILTDKYGHRLSCVTLGSLLLSLGHALILSSIKLSYLPSLLIGISNGLLACCWPCIPLLISPNNLAVGLSLLSCGINLAYTICPPLLSRLTDPGYTISEYYTVLISACAAFTSLFIVFVNESRGYGLNGKRTPKI
ncbi:hypothetical protein NEHOM01_0607 [Nematocida homosporus]|uniref:uncharacterized protein n=1 Tax=Nematocida homosporus TaxID=1912981 RepID=UPI0022210A88|nr:uncharacterized protein NEHOM01_0607 [Nematocida homosporus]KAI5185102.1 hypothetical protein NEHOM01_0607 [Nematocida homosporus]